MRQHFATRWVVAFALVAVSFVSFVSPALVRAATVTANAFFDRADGPCATSGTGECTLREAVIYANARSGTTIQLLAGTYALTLGLPSSDSFVDDDNTVGDLSLYTTTTIVGAGAANTVINGSGMRPYRDRVLRVFSGYPDTGESVRITGVTITGGWRGPTASGNIGTAIRNYGTLTLTDVRLTGNSAGSSLANDGSLVALRSTVSANADSGSLGDTAGFSNLRGGANVYDSVFTDNSCEDCLGGAVVNGRGGVLTLTRSTVSNNTSRRSSGGNAGGIYNSGTFHISNTTVAENRNARTMSDGSGGVMNTGTFLSSQSTISGNAIDGGSFFSGKFGGGIFNSTGGVVALADSTLSGNSVGVPFPPNLSPETSAGGIYNSVARDDGTGGGIVQRTLLTLTFVTMAGNTARTTGGMYNGDLATLSGTLLDNPGGNCAPAGAATTSDDYNLANDASCASLTQPHDRQNTNPRLAPLADNCGPTRTHALLPNSPAIDAGGTSANDCPRVDQRGVARPQGTACDIGAYEVTVSAQPPVRPSAPTVAPPMPQPAPRPNAPFNAPPNVQPPPRVGRSDDMPAALPTQAATPAVPTPNAAPPRR